MASFKTLVRRILAHPARQISVITLTLGIMLLSLWPSADKYIALRAEQKQLAGDLELAKIEASRVEHVKVDQTEVSERLAAMQRRAITGDQIDSVREELTSLVRTSQCQFRRIEVSDAQRRAWRGGEDNPLDDQEGEADLFSRGTGFDLWSCQITLSVSGPLEALQTLLSSVHTMKKLVYIGAVQIQPEGVGKELQLRMNIRFFGLVKAAPSEDGLPPGAPPAPTGA